MSNFIMENPTVSSFYFFPWQCVSKCLSLNFQHKVLQIEITEVSKIDAKNTAQLIARPLRSDHFAPGQQLPHDARQLAQLGPPIRQK